MTTKTTLKNTDLEITLINQPPEVESMVEVMLDERRPKVKIIEELKQMMCYFEWSIQEVSLNV